MAEVAEGDVCYTFEAAIEMAAQMEDEGFRSYLAALRIVKDRAARQIFKDAALDELEHKHQLEKWLVEGQMKGGDDMRQTVPTMNLDYVLAKRELRPDSDAREALAYAIHLEKGSIEFYQKMSRGCEGAPMGKLFQQMLADETRHLQSLEDLYECHFMAEN
jgi:rubrerythrin